MAKPTKRILDWASSGNAVDPGASKEANGWFIAERPPAYWWNWILQSFGEWLGWLGRSGASVRYTGLVELGASPQVLWETGDSISGFAAATNDIDLTFTTGVASSTDNSVFIQGRSDNLGQYLFECGWTSTTTLRLHGYDPNDSTDQNLNVGTSSPVVWILIYE